MVFILIKMCWYIIRFHAQYKLCKNVLRMGCENDNYWPTTFFFNNWDIFMCLIRNCWNVHFNYDERRVSSNRKLHGQLSTTICDAFFSRSKMLGREWKPSHAHRIELQVWLPLRSVAIFQLHTIYMFCAWLE